MPTHIEVDIAVPLVVDEFVRLDDLVAELDASQWSRPSPLAGWSVRDIVAHVIGTESMLAGRAAPAPPTAMGSHVRNAIGEANEAWVAHWRDGGPERVLHAFRDIVAERTAALLNCTQDDFDTPSWTPAGPDETYGRFMRIRHFDCFLHELDIRDALGLGDPAGVADHVDFTLDEVESSLGYVVGKRAGAQPGQSVRFALRGELERDIDVEVSNRARVAKLSSAPTTTLEVDVYTALRAMGGRRPLAEDDYRIDGDSELGSRLVANLNYTV